MLKKITRILPFFIVTMLSIGGVELFYGLAEHYLLVPEKAGVIETVVTRQESKPAPQPKQHKNYQVIVERNLFQSYLQEPAPVEPAKNGNPLEGLETTSLDLVLMGTITGQSGRSRAIILEKAQRKQEIYYQGDFIQDAEIKDILRGKVILNYQGRDEILDMTEASSMRPKQVTPAAVSPAKPRRRVVSRPAPRTTRKVAPQVRTRIEPADDAEEDSEDEEVVDEDEQPEDEAEAEEGEAVLKPVDSVVEQ